MSRALAAVLMVQLLFGIWPVAGAAAMGQVPPFAIIGYRVFLGAPLLFVLVVSTRPVWPQGRDWLWLAFLGFTGITANQLLFIKGLQHAGPIIGTLFSVVIPANTILIAFLFGREQPKLRQVLGVAVTFVGILLLVRIEDLDMADGLVVGAGYFVANTGSYGLYLVLGKPVFQRLGAMPALSWVFVFGMLWAVPFVAPAVTEVAWLELSSATWIALVYILLGATLGTYFLNAYALKTLKSSMVSIFVMLQPLVGIVAAYLVFGDVPTLRTMASGAVILGGTALAVWPRRV